MINESFPKDLQVQEWIKKATEDELFTTSMLKHLDAHPNGACFHSQQMAEKYLKAFLVHCKRWYPKIHPLDALWELCREIDPSFDAIKEDSIFLTSLYGATRYPGDYPEFSWAEAKRAFESASRIKEFILEKIREKAGPTGIQSSPRQRGQNL